MKVLFSLSVMLLLCSTLTFAQETDTKAQTETQSQSQTEKKEASTDQKIEGVYVYSPRSLRDPFVSPFDLEQLKGSKKRRPGIQGMSINEVVVQGVVQSKKRGYEALLLGSDNKIYWIKAGDELFDGRVLSIGFAKREDTGRVDGVVVFRQDIDDPNQLKPYRDITKFSNK